MSSSTEFRFKQFIVKNTDSALKVNTDGVLLGAWAPTDNAKMIWDVGCGTGVIALMAAQKSVAEIIGIEIDPVSAVESDLNFKRSPWATRLSVSEGDVRSLYMTLPKPDFIISNPPFFSSSTNNLHSPDSRKSTARHDDTLTFDTLISISSKSLTDEGNLAMISPADRENEIILSVTLHGMSVKKKTFVRSTPTKPFTRILWLISKTVSEETVDKLTLRSLDGGYSNEYKQLVKDFYINL